MYPRGANHHHEVVDAFGLPRIALDGYEADDIIATLVRETREEGHSPVLVISGDKDLLQLSAHEIVKTGIARTFQNIELFEVFSRFKNIDRLTS